MLKRVLVPSVQKGNRSRLRQRLLPALLLMLAVPTAAAQQQAVYQPHVVVVQFESGIVLAEGATQTGLAAFDRTAAAFNLRTVERMFPFLDHVQPTPETVRNLAALRRTYYVRYRADDDPERVARALSSARGVVYAEPVPVNRAFGPASLVDPDDSLYSDQTYLRHLRLPEAWDSVKGSVGSPPVAIAVVDGGGDWRHEDLRANVWTNPGEIAGNGIDDDNNGFIDDVHGVNFANGDDTDNDPTGLPATPFNAAHGTGVAGAASAVTDNTVGMAGAAWNAELMHVNVSCPTSEFICYAYEGVLYAAANGAAIINTSWGGYASSDANPAGLRWINQTLDLATDLGGLVVPAALNDNLNNDFYPAYPSNHSRVLSVGATEKDSRRKASFSSYGKRVNVFAPGADIITTAPDNTYSVASGTSFAAPLVSGVAALVKTRFPSLSPDALREQIRLASENIDVENPAHAGQLGRGYVNAAAAVQAPAHPGVRVKRWWWEDADGDGLIVSGDQVTIHVVVVNHLADAHQLTVGLTAAASYPFIDMTTAEQSVGSLARDDSVEVTFSFTIASDAPNNRRVRFDTRIREGGFEDSADQLSLGINRTLEPVHAALSALYTATDGDNWYGNTGWDITTVPGSTQELARWYGPVSYTHLTLPTKRIV